MDVRAKCDELSVYKGGGMFMMIGQNIFCEATNIYKRILFVICFGETSGKSAAGGVFLVETFGYNVCARTHGHHCRR